MQQVVDAQCSMYDMTKLLIGFWKVRDGATLICFFFFYCFLIFSLSNKQTNKTTKCKVIVMHHFLGYFYSLDMEVFVIYDFITQTTYTITYMQMETLKYLLLENLQFTLERQGQGDSLQILLLKGTKTHKFQNANPEKISLPHPNFCVLPSAL